MAALRNVASIDLLAQHHQEPSARQRFGWIALAAGLHGLLLCGAGASAPSRPEPPPARTSPEQELDVVFATLTPHGSENRGGSAERPALKPARAPARNAPRMVHAARAEDVPNAHALAVDLASIAEVAAAATSVPGAAVLAEPGVDSVGEGPAPDGSGSGHAGSDTDGFGTGSGSGGNLARAFPEPTTTVRCSWPAEGEDLDHDFERVTVRARVASNGRVISADASRGPRAMFMEAAIECVRQVPFEPARDQQGRAVTALSEPIVVRFVRYRPGETWR